MPLNLIVCIKQVPDWEAPADTFKIDPERNKVIPPPNIDPRISLFDEHAIEAAIQLREKHGGKVTIVSLGPDFAQRAVKQAVAMGADEGILLKDPAFEDSYTYATAYILAEAIKKIVDLEQILAKQTTQLRQGHMAIRQYLIEFGMTPSARTRVKLPAGGAKKPVDPLAAWMARTRA